MRCDADQPCNQCTRSGIVCTYGSTTSRQSATSYARNLERQVAELQRQLQALGNTPGRSNSETSSQSRQDQFDLLVAPGDDLVLQQTNGQKVYRFSAALNVLRTIADMIGDDRTASPTGRALVEMMESPIDLPARASDDWMNALLPPREKVWDKVSRAIEIALVCHDCIDKASLKARLYAMLDQPGSNNTPQRKSLLSLLYALLALGELYDGVSGGNQSADDAEARRLCG